MTDVGSLILVIMAAIIAYPQIRKGIVAIKKDIELLIKELRRRGK